VGQEPIRGLSAALRDPSQWIRLGAARAALSLAPTAAVDLLEGRASELSTLPVEETANIALALAGAGGNPLPLVAKLLQDDVSSVRRALAKDYPRWEEYAVGRIRRTSLPNRSYRLLSWLFAAWSRGEGCGKPQTERALTDPIEERASIALRRFSFWKREATDLDNRIELKRVIETTFADALEHLEAQRTCDAAERLVEVAVTSRNAWVRGIAGFTLSALGSDASPLLLAMLAGDRGPRPGAEVVHSMEKDSWGLTLPPYITPDDLAAFFAAQILEKFADAETAFAVVSAAIAWPNELRVRAAHVAARMSASAALPPLVWSALYLPSASERPAAMDLLERIVGKDEDLGIRFHHIDSTELHPGQLDWLCEIASARIPARNWMRDPSVCISILSQAIAIMPDIVGDVGSRYHDATEVQLAAGFLNSISRLFASFRGVPAIAQARYPQISFPEFCRLGDEEKLSVQLLLASTGASSPPIRIEFPRNKDQVELLVTVRAPGFFLAVDRMIMSVSRDGASDTAVFHLRARTAGQQAIDIKFMLGAAIVGHCCVVTHVTTEPRRGEAAAIVLDPIDPDTLQLHESAQAVLRVSTLPDRKLEWSIVTPDGGFQPLGNSERPFDLQEASRCAEQQGPLIRSILKDRLSPTDMAGVRAQLSAHGHRLYAQIAPPTLAVTLNELDENALVVVDSDADWIPWELLACGPTEKLWADRFILVRAPVMTKPASAKVAQPAPLPRAIDRALLIIGDKVAEPKRIAHRTFGTMAKRAEPALIEGDWNELCDRVRGRDIVHFTCHGRRAPTYHLSYKPGVGGQLVPGQAHALGLKWGAVVFANACNSGEPELFLSEFQSFGREFYYAGARPFIGTLGPIPEEEAIEFAGLFYEQFALAGLPAGQALRRAKEEAAKRFDRPIWLFYCLYGNPSVVRRWSAAVH